MALVSGTRFGPYTVSDVVGRGATSTVYRASEPGHPAVALKLLRAELLIEGERDATLARFHQEARLGRMLRHPNIVQLFDWGELEGTPFMAMGLVEGEPLLSLLNRSGALPPHTACAVVAAVLDALAYAHGHRITHRDVKPANIVLREAGGPVLMDFGIAHVEGSQLTHLGDLIGTPAYLAPEQLRGERVDGRADIFAAATVAYEALAGQRPFNGTLAQIMRQVCFEDPPPPSRLRPYLAPADAVLMRGLAKDPGQRFQTAREFAEALLALSFDAEEADGPDRFVETVVARPRTAQSIETLRVELRSLLQPAALRLAEPEGGANRLSVLLDGLPEGETWQAAALCCDEGVLPLLPLLRAQAPVPKGEAPAAPWLAFMRTAGMLLDWAARGSRAVAAQEAMDDLAEEVMGAALVYASDTAHACTAAEALDLAAVAGELARVDALAAGLLAAGESGAARAVSAAGHVAALHVLGRSADVVASYAATRDPMARFDVVATLIEAERLVELAARLLGVAAPDGIPDGIAVRAYATLERLLDSVLAMLAVSEELLDASLDGADGDEADTFCGYLGQVRLIYRFCVLLDGKDFAPRLARLAASIHALFTRLAAALSAENAGTAARQVRLTAIHDAAVALDWQELASSLLAVARSSALASPALSSSTPASSTPASSTLAEPVP